MPAKKLSKICLLLCLLVSSLLACSVLPGVSSTGTPTTSGTFDGASTPALNVWYQATTGIETRYEDWKSPGDNEDTVTIMRIDLRRVHISVGYQPDQPLMMSDWMKKEHALAIINGGYFDNKNNATSLIVSDGQVSGTSYTGFGGMLYVDAQGNAGLRSLSQQPYDPNNEQLQQATQSSPILMVNGQRTNFEANAASQRRSVIAMDKQGRLLLIVSPDPAFSLDELADLLVASDLSIQTALNLDGGASTGLYANVGNQQITVNSLAQLPIVIILKPAT